MRLSLGNSVYVKVFAVSQYVWAITTVIGRKALPHSTCLPESLYESLAQTKMCSLHGLLESRLCVYINWLCCDKLATSGEILGGFITKGQTADTAFYASPSGTETNGLHKS